MAILGKKEKAKQEELAREDTTPGQELSLEEQAKLERAAKKEALLEHVKALRNTLIVCVAAAGVGFLVILYGLIDPLMDFIIKPIVDRGIQVIYTAPSEAMMTKLKVALIAGVVVASPVIFWQIWRFISPALYPKEKRSFRLLFVIALLLFLGGVVFAYYAVFMLAIDFFLVAGENLATPMLSIDNFVTFNFAFILPFGVMFELPIAIYMLAKRGKVNYEKLTKYRKYVIFAIFVIAAVLTPPDVVSQTLLALPMCLLYEVGVQVARVVKPTKKPA